MKLVLFKDLLEENAMPQYGILTDGDKPDVICLCCGGTLEFDDYKIIEELDWVNLSEYLKEKQKGEKGNALFNNSGRRGSAYDGRL